MEGFSLLKYWRGGGHGAARRRTSSYMHTESATVANTTSVTAHQTAETDDDNDEGPFFDLEFSAVGDGAEDEEGENEERRGNGTQKNDSEESDDTGADDDSSADDIEEFDFALCSSPADHPPDPNAAESPSEDLFFKGRLVSAEPDPSLEPKSPQISVSLQKSPTKFRVLLLKFKKSKLNTGDETGEAKKKSEEHDGEGKNKRSKFSTVKFKVEEVPIVSFFTRENKRPSGDESVSDEKKFSKEVMQKYLKKVKPLYIKVSRRYGEKLGFSEPLSSAEAPPSTAAKKKQLPETDEKQHKQGSNALGRLRVVTERLGKSKSASEVVAAAPSTPASWQRRDDSLLQVEDGIQSAILHCKRSFNGGSRDSTILPAWVSEELDSEEWEVGGVD